LFTVKDFGDRRISSEDSIVAIFDVITAVLLNIFGLLDMLLKALESIETSSSIGPKTEDMHLDNIKYRSSEIIIFHPLPSFRL